jgi:hypothetical protein
MAPGTEKSYGEAGVLLATDYGGLKCFHGAEVADVMAKRLAIKKLMPTFSPSLSLSLSLSLSFLSHFLFSVFSFL